MIWALEGAAYSMGTPPSEPGLSPPLTHTHAPRADQQCETSYLGLGAVRIMWHLWGRRTGAGRMEACCTVWGAPSDPTPLPHKQRTHLTIYTYTCTPRHDTYAHIHIYTYAPRPSIAPAPCARLAAD